ncbi:MAG: hypothetical protein AAB511_01100 [Patescibacteria group bacterium]
MSQKTATIIIIIFVLMLALGFLAFYFYTNQGQGVGIGTTDPRGNIFPGGGTGGGGTEVPGGNTTPEGGTGGGQGGTPQIVPVLKELSTRPSAGAVSIATSTSVLVRFIERGSGNVYEVSPQDNSEKRLSNTTIPKIEEALWDKTGTQVIARYTGDTGDLIKTYSATLTENSATEIEGKLQGSFMTDNIDVVAKSPDQTKIFYLLQNSAGTTGIVSDFNGGKKTQVFDSPLQEWLVEWPTATQVALNTKPSAGAPGFLFLLNTATGALTRAISSINGLTTLVNPRGTMALYSESIFPNLSFKIYSFTDGSTKETPVATLPEKCVWSKNDSDSIYCSVPTYIPDGTYPDIWYRGQVLFSDEIWKIDSTTGTGELLANIKKSANKDVDGINLFLSPNEDYLFFTSKSDFHVWSLRLLP